MSATDDWHALRERYEVFLATELGKLYHEYDLATIDYWRNGLNQTISTAKLREMDDRCRAATNRFVAKLMDLAGIE